MPSTVGRGIWGQALPLPRLPAHWAGCWGPRSTCCGRGRAGVGALLCPLGLHALWGLRAAGRVRGVRVPGGGLGGGGACAVPPVRAARGGACRAGGRSASFRPSAFPGQATKRVSLASCCPWGAWPPIPLQFVLTRLLWARSVRRPGALTIPPASEDGGRGPCGLRAGGGVGGGGVAPRPPCSPSGWRPAVLNPGPPRVAGALPSGVRVWSGSQCRPRGGGVRGGPWTAPPGAPADLNPPSALPG